MDTLTDSGRAALEAAATRHGVSLDAARAMLDGLVAGRGAQAQFSHPELGGMGQWSQGGMLMIGDMFNNGLKARVGALASDLAGLATDPAAFAAAPRGRGDWWPEDLGRPASLGAQNDMRYAVFPETRRLAVDRGGRVALYDTGDHVIGGASQQQGGGQTLTFSSQHGPVSLESLRRLDAPSHAENLPPASAPAHADAPPPAPASAQAEARAPGAPAAAPAPAAPTTHAAAPSPRPGAPSPDPGADLLTLIERLADLHARGILSDEEFAAKKKELLARL